MTTERKTKRERLAAIMAEITTSQIRELPPECDMAEASTTSEVSTPKEITIVQDGKTLHGSTWVLPQDYSEAEVADGSLPSVKGATPEELPTLGDDQGG